MSKADLRVVCFSPYSIMGCDVPFTFRSKLQSQEKGTCWPRSDFAVVYPCLRSSWHGSGPFWMIPSGVGLCPAMGSCMWMSVWSFTDCGAPCSLFTAFPWGHTSSQWSKCVLWLSDRAVPGEAELAGEGVADERACVQSALTLPSSKAL